jgi:crotonobetainyl-CoA:carnitine CoA-transferase CaiB-like acyl-CoA transferase
MPENSLYWLASNVNKRGISLDIERREGQDILRRLVSTSDVVIESFPPGYLNQLGLGYGELAKLNERIIVTSITPFGQSGPYSDYKTSDLVSMSMGGITWLTGDPDRPPVTVGVPQAFLLAGQYAAIGTLLALYYREMSGKGQHVDISIQQSVLPVTLNTIPHWTLNRDLVKRAGNRRSGLTSGAPQRQTWRCKDGFITLTIYGGARGVRPNRVLVEWLDEEGMATDDLRSRDWSTFDLGKVTSDEWEAIEGPIAEFFLKHTRAELFEGAVKRRIMLFPVYDFEDLISDHQLKARKFWTTVACPGMGDILFPGPFAQCSESPIGIRRPAPGPGEHNMEIYRDTLGMTEEQLNLLKQNDVI